MGPGPAHDAEPMCKTPHMTPALVHTYLPTFMGPGPAHDAEPMHETPHMTPALVQKYLPNSMGPAHDAEPMCETPHPSKLDSSLSSPNHPLSIKRITAYLHPKAGYGPRGEFISPDLFIFLH